MKYLLTLLLLCFSVKASPVGFSQNGSLNYGLVGWWTMNEGSGTNAFDYSSYGNTGTGTNSPIWTNGVIGGAVYLNLTNGFKASSPFSSQSAFSVSFWIQDQSSCATLSTAYHRVVCWTIGITNVQIGMCPSNSSAPYGPPGFYIQSSSNTTCTLLGAYLANSNAVHHIVATYNTSTYHIYLDGQIADKMSNPSQVASTPFISSNLWVGQRGNGAGVIGMLDDVRIYNRAISADEVSQLYGGGYGKQ